MEKRDSLNARIIKKLAEEYDLDKRSIYRIIEGTQKNDQVFDDYMLLRECVENTIESYKTSPLLQAVNELIPFK